MADYDANPFHEKNYTAPSLVEFNTSNPAPISKEYRGVYHPGKVTDDWQMKKKKKHFMEEYRELKSKSRTTQYTLNFDTSAWMKQNRNYKAIHGLQKNDHGVID